jgi:predicted RNA binding protein YcfA (HicA-like mRNA interferase family)
MSKLHAIKSRKFIRFIRQLGYQHERMGRGSHERYHFKGHVSGDGNLTFARSAGTIPGGTLNGMLKLISEHTGISVSELREMLGSL